MFRHLGYQSHGNFGLNDGMYWHVSAPVKVSTHDKLPTSPNTSGCRHVLTPWIPLIWIFLFGYWEVLACVNTWKRCRHMKMPARACTCDTNHVDFIRILGCADMCQHLERCRHLWRCRHDVLACADTTRCRQLGHQLYGFWDVLTFCSTWKNADTWRMLSAQVS